MSIAHAPLNSDGLRYVGDSRPCRSCRSWCSRVASTVGPATCEECGEAVSGVQVGPRRPRPAFSTGTQPASEYQ